MDDLSGSTIRGYELRQRIGYGGFGAVYRAYQTIVQREVAIKIILPEHANQPEFIRRFEVEAQIVARLEHLHIVPLYDYWRDPHGAYLVMRYLRGGSLQDALQQGGAWSLLQIPKLVDQIAAALTLAHRRGVIHRDIKPANILLDEDGNFFLTDFGIAKDLQKSAEVLPEEGFFGSPEYVSPEQVLREPLSPQADIYSLGIVLFEVLTGQRPFDAPTDTTVMRQHVSRPLPSILDIRPDLPAALDIVIKRATAKYPGDRYPNAQNLAVDLHTIISFVEAHPKSPRLQSANLPYSDDINSKLLGSRLLSTHESNTLILETTSSGDENLKTKELPVDAEIKLRNPYKGLRPFEEADAADFNGRESLVNSLITHLTQANFLAVVGPSGSGKSSVVKAGLIPVLRRMAALERDGWFIALMTPGVQPLVNLREALSSVAVRLPDNLDKELAQNQYSLHLALDDVLPTSNDQLVLVIDQFEELFTLVADEANRTHFLSLLHNALTVSGSRLRVVVTLRADFYDRPLVYPAFGNLMSQYTRVVLPLGTAELREVISAPAEQNGLTLQAGLVDAIINDVHEQPGALPLLQYALTELFERREGNQLTLDAYQEIGGVSGALARRADEIYDQLDGAGQEAARQMFLRLISLGESGDDTGTRRRVMQVELESLGGDAMKQVIALFGQHRLLIFNRDVLTRAPTIEIAHEALLHQWKRLNNWLDNSRAALQIQRRMALEVSEWLRAERDPGFLATGSRLSQFEALTEEVVIALTEHERTYLQASLERRHRTERLRQAVVTVLIVFSLVTLAMAALAHDRERQAVVERVRADQEAAIARSRELAVTALINVEDHLDLALLLSLEAQQAADTFEARSSLVTALQAQPHLISFLHGHSDGVRTVAVDPQGYRMASSGQDHTIILWDFETRKIIQTLVGHEDWVNNITFAPNGQTLASADEDGVIRLWDVQTGRLMGQPLINPDGAIWAITFTTDGKMLVSGDELGTIRLWDIMTGELVGQPMAEHTDLIFSLGIHGNKLVSASADGTIRLWDVMTGALVGQPMIEHTDWVLTVAFSPNGTLLASGGADNIIRLWDVETQRLLGQLSGHRDWIRSIAFLDNSKLVSGSADGSIRMWDIHTGQSSTLGNHQGAVWDVAVSPDKRWLISGGTDQKVMLWDVTHNQGLSEVFAEQAEAVTSVAIYGGLLASANGNPSGSGKDNTIQLWDRTNGSQIAILAGHQSGVTDLAFSPDGRWLASASVDQTVRLWDVETGEAINAPLTGHTDAVMTVAINDDGTVIASAGFDQTIRLWDAQTGTPRNEPFTSHTDAILSLAFSPDGAVLASGSFDNTVRLWNWATGQELNDPLLGHTGAVTHVVFSHDGHFLASTSRDGTTRVWDLMQNPITSRVLTGHQNWVLAAAFHPLQPLLATGSRDNTIILWDLSPHRALGQPLAQHTDWVSTLMFDPGGSILYSGSHDRSVRAWKIHSAEWRELACRIANRDFTPLEAQQYLSDILPTPKDDGFWSCPVIVESG